MSRFSAARLCHDHAKQSARLQPWKKGRENGGLLGPCSLCALHCPSPASQPPLNNDKIPPATDDSTETSPPRHDATEQVRWREVYKTTTQLLSDGQAGTIQGKWRYYGNWDDPAAQPYVSSSADSRVVPIEERYYDDHWVYHWSENRWEFLENSLDTKQWVRLTGWVLHADWADGSWGGNSANEYNYAIRTKSGTLTEIHDHWYNHISNLLCAGLSLVATVVAIGATFATAGLSTGGAIIILSASAACFTAALDAFFRDEPMGSVYEKGGNPWVVRTQGATNSVLVRVPTTRDIFAVIGTTYIG